MVARVFLGQRTPYPMKPDPQRVYLGIIPETVGGVWFPYEWWQKWVTDDRSGANYYQFYQHTRVSWAWWVVINDMRER